MLAATATGPSHRQRGEPNQDACGLASSLDRTLILVASDGAGSARCGGAGAEAAVNAALRFASALKPPEREEGMLAALLGSLWAARSALEALASEQDAPLRDYACTLLLSFASNDWLGALQLGDGAVVGRTRDGALKRLTVPCHGPYAGETTFLTSADYLKTLSVCCLPSAEVDALALLTDGLEPVALQGDTPFAPFFEPLFAFAQRDPDAARRLEAFLTSERLARRSHDDKTLLLAVRP